MANINFGLLDTQYPEKLANALVRSPEQQNANMLQVMQMQQLMDQREQAQYALGKSRREDTGMAEFGNAIKALGPDPSLLAIAQVFMKHPNPEYQLKGFELQRQAQADKGYRDLGPMGGAPAARPAVAPAPGSFGENMLANLAGLPSFGDNQPAVNAGSFASAAPMTEEGRIAEIQPRLALLFPLKNRSTDAKAEYDMLMAELIELRKPETITPGSIRRRPGYATFTAPEATSQDIRTMQALGYPNTQAGYTAFRDAQRQDRLLTPAEEEQRIRIAGASRPPAQPRPEQPAQPVIDPDNPGKIILVSREEAIRRRMTPANTVEKPMTQAQRVRYAKDKVSDKDVVTGAFAVTGELEKLTDELVGNPDKKIAPAPGLNSITGYSALTNPLALPSGDARKALQKLDTFKGKIMALGRQLASQEGKLGNMAVQEWKFVSDAVQKLDPAAGNLDAQMRDVVRQSKEYALRQQSKYDDTYADDLTAPPAGANKPTLSPVDQQALTWATANPTDPRSAQIKQRLGR